LSVFALILDEIPNPNQETHFDEPSHDPYSSSLIESQRNRFLPLWICKSKTLNQARFQGSRFSDRRIPDRNVRERSSVQPFGAKFFSSSQSRRHPQRLLSIRPDAFR
jgi:hypothetical protein